MRNIIRPILYSVIIILLLPSCAVRKKVVYFQDLPNDTTFQTKVESSEITVRPKDKLSIVVSSRDPMLQDLFNLPYVIRQLGQAVYSNNGNTYGSAQGVLTYTVDSEGNIDFPVIGKLHIAGLTREGTAAYIKQQLVDGNFVSDPVVTVEFVNLSYNVMGEVAKPGRYTIDKDRITIVDALSMAGDLSILARRDAVKVVRQAQDGTCNVYVLNMTSAEQLYKSPAYYLQQNDVIYVEPNNVRARQSTVNGNNVLSTSFWLSLTSTLTSVAVLIVQLAK